MISILKILVGNKNISFAKSVCLILILISAPLLFSQRMLLDNSIENKNQLFEVLGVKKQITQYHSVWMSDSIISESSQTLFFDSSGYVIKKEGFNSWSNPPKSVIEFERDKNGNIIQILSDAKLVESKSYNDSNKVIQWSFYKADTLFSTWNIKYDSLGNQLVLIAEYPSGKIDTSNVAFFEYNYRYTMPRLLKETQVDDGDTSIYIYDEFERIKQVIHRYSSYTDSIMHFYLGVYRDSSILYSQRGIEKLTREYDERLRCDRMISYNQSDSLLFDMIFEYDDYGIEIRDSIFIANDIEIPQKTYDEMMGEQIVSRVIVNGKVSFTKTTSYYPNGLLKQMIKTDYDQNRIEETYYEYEFY